MAIKPKLQSLLASANDVTGEERTNLTDAMQDLVDGYGQGGASSLIIPFSTLPDYFNFPCFSPNIVSFSEVE